jgi:hypothetical protein
MKTSTSLKRSPLAFFVLVFALSLLFGLLVALLGPLAGHFSPALPIAIPSGFNPVSPIVVGYIPLLAACILVFRERQSFLMICTMLAMCSFPILAPIMTRLLPFRSRRCLLSSSPSSGAQRP